MQILFQFIVLIAGLILVIKGADFLVDGSSAMAKRFNIPEIVIGLTIVSMGTSAPELIVNIFSSIQGKNEIVLGNIIGSNIVNGMFILGVSALIFPLVVKKNTVAKEMPFNIAAVALLYGFANFSLKNINSPVISRFEAFLLLLMFAVFMYYVYTLTKNNKEDSLEIHKMPLYLSFVLIIGGLAGLLIGGKFTVDSAVNIAQFMGVSEKLIALTIVSIGTSLPELATSVVAALKKKPDIAVGNVIGSNIFNILLIIGISGMINPIKYLPVFNIDLAILFTVSILIIIFMFTGKKHHLGRFEGGILVVGYILYITYLLVRDIIFKS